MAAFMAARLVWFVRRMIVFQRRAIRSAPCRRGWRGPAGLRDALLYGALQGCELSKNKTVSTN